VRVQKSGRPNSVTEYRVVARYPRARLTYVSLLPHTGRTHQLRVQAADRGMPIAGDDRYGDFRANRFLAQAVGLKHMFLHAHRLEFRHPLRGHLLKFTREVPSRLAQPLERINSLDASVPRRSAEKGDSRRR
jgi:23S rRNA pseudouridine955/2504/2580 synthase